MASNMIQPRKHVIPLSRRSPGISALTRTALKELKYLFCGGPSPAKSRSSLHNFGPLSLQDVVDRATEHKRSMGVSFKLKLHPGGTLPTYATLGSVGMDLYAAEDATVWPLQVTKVRLGFACELPKGFELQIRSRSGLAAQGVMVVNSPGTIDPDYRGEVCVLLTRLSQDNNPFNVKRGDRIAQAVLTQYTTAKLVVTEELNETTRSSNGFGSTGTR